MREHLKNAVGVIAVVSLLAARPQGARPADDDRPASVPTFSDTGVQVGALLEPLRLHSLDGEPYRLSSVWRDRPALLVLSSISCPVSRDNCAAVDRLARRYAGKVQVAVIYTLEAHPRGAPSPYSDREWLTDRNVQDGVLVKQPANIAERIAAAKQYRTLKRIEAPLVVDAMDNRAWTHIGPGPNTAILVSREGKVLFRQGWLEPAGMEAAIRWTVAHIHDKALRERANALSESLGFDVIDKLRWLNLDENRPHLERIFRGDPELVNLMIGTGRGDDPGDTLLHKAVIRGGDELAFVLLYMPKIDQANSAGRTPLHLAAERDDATTVGVLLARGADPNAFDNQGLTPSHLASLAGHPDLVKQLVAAGGAMDIRLAAGLGDLAALQRYVDIYRRTDIYLTVRGGAALSFAAANNQTAALDLLLDEGVDATVEVDRHPPFYYAVYNRRHEAVAALLERRVDSDVLLGDYLGGPLHYAAWKADRKLIGLLIQHGADVEQLNRDEETPLHLAAESGDANCVKSLLAAGAKIDARTGHEAPRPCGPPDLDGRPRLDTPLHLAVKSGRGEVVALLLASQATTNLKNRAGQTPLDLALEIQTAEPSDERAKIVKLLTAAGRK